MMEALRRNYTFVFVGLGLTAIGFIGRGIWWPISMAIFGGRWILDELIIVAKTIKGKTCLVVKVED